MSDHNGAPRPAPQPVNDDLHPDERFPGINYPHDLTPPPYNADAEHPSDPNQLREDPGFLRQAGGLVLRLGRHLGHAVGHQVHERAHDLRETWHESTQGLIGHPSSTRGARAHLRDQQLAQLDGRHPHVANIPFASHQRHGAGKTLQARLERADTLAQKVGIVVETIVPDEAVLDTWPESWQSFIDPRNIIALRNTYLGMPMGNIKNLLPSERADMESRLMVIRAGGFKRLPEPLQRAYLGMARNRAAGPESPSESTPSNVAGAHDDEGAHVLAMLDYVDRALRVSVLAPDVYQEMAQRITDRPTEADEGIDHRIAVYESRCANHVYDYPDPWTFNPRTNDQERQLADRQAALEAYLARFDRLVTDPKDRDADLADVYRQELDQVKDQAAKLRNGKKPR